MDLAIFDVDGTLLDNLRAEDECYARALRECLGIETLVTDWARYEHVTDQGIAVEAFTSAFGAPPSVPAVAATVEYFVDLLAAEYRTAPITSVAGASTLLRALPASGWAIALATGAWRRAAEFKLHAAGLVVAGVPIATAEDGPARTAIVAAARTRAEQMHGTSFRRVVAVGDGVWDVAAARALVLPFVGVATGKRAERLRAAGATTVLADFASVPSTMSAFEQADVPLAAGR